jgi:hypothetical protein
MIVTCFYDIYGSPALTAQSFEYFRGLASSGLRILVFTDAAQDSTLKAYYPSVQFVQWSLDLLESFKLAMRASSLPAGFRSAEETREYLALTNAKADFMHMASQMYPREDTLLWLDFDVLRKVKDHAAFIRRLAELDAAHFQRMLLPGFWPAAAPSAASVFPDAAYWRFTDEFFVCPRAYAAEFKAANLNMLRKLYAASDACTLTWVMNVWAMLEADTPAREYMEWYGIGAHHDDAIVMKCPLTAVNKGVAHSAGGAFAITSAGPHSQDLFLRQAIQFPSSLAALFDVVEATRTARDADLPYAMTLSTCTSFANARSEALGSLLRAAGSDKASIHNYHHVYSWLLDPSRAYDLLEIGLGTNNVALVSNMGVAGVPGASLRAFRDYLPLANIYGADVDAEILFSEPRIKTAHVDQLSPASLAALPAALGCAAFDIIIDDGLHSLGANLNTLVFGLAHLKIGGTMIIEDILAHAAVDAWRTIDVLLTHGPFFTRMIQGKHSKMFLVTRNG